MKILYLDLETTGVDENYAGIYQLSGIVEIDGKVIETFDLHINPGNVHVDDWVVDNLKDHGKSLKDLLNYIDDEDAFMMFKSVLDSHINQYDKTDKFTICGYNVQFDDRFLRRWFIKHEDRFFGSYFWPNTLDIIALATLVLLPIRNKLTNFKLSTLCHIFNIPIEAHDSMSDITATRNLYLGLKNYFNLKELK